MGFLGVEQAVLALSVDKADFKLTEIHVHVS